MKERPYYGRKEVEHLTGRSRATIFRWRNSGYLPQPVEIGPNTVGWYKTAFDAWLLSRPPRECKRPIASSKPTPSAVELKPPPQV